MPHPLSGSVAESGLPADQVDQNLPPPQAVDSVVAGGSKPAKKIGLRRDPGCPGLTGQAGSTSSRPCRHVQRRPRLVPLLANTGSTKHDRSRARRLGAPAGPLPALSSRPLAELGLSHSSCSLLPGRRKSSYWLGVDDLGLALKLSRSDSCFREERS